MKKSYALLFASLAAGPVAAQTTNWTGTADAVWSNAANWNPSLPVAASTAVFDATSLNNTAISLTGATTVAALQLSTAGAPVSIAGGFALTAGAITLNGSNGLTVQNGTSAFNMTSLSGAGSLTINKSNTINWTTAGTLDAANDLNFSGTLTLRGGAGSTAPNTVGNSWTAVGGAAMTQAAGTAFALDTGSSIDTLSGAGARDFIVADAFTGATLNLSSLSGFGSIRCDWGGTAATITRTVRVNQAGDTTFNGMFLSHHGTGGRIRNLALEKDGLGTLTMAGLVGRQTASTGGTTDQVPITVNGGKLVLSAENTRQGPVTIASGATLQVGAGGATGSLGSGTVALDGSLTIDRSGTLTFANVLTGAGAFLKDGSGTLALSGNSSGFTGTTTLAEGTTYVSADLSGSPVTVQSGARLRAGTVATPGNGLVKSLTLESGSLSTFRAGFTFDDIVVSDADGLVVNGPHVIQVAPTGGLLPGESISIIDYSGTFSGFANLSLAPGSRFTLVHNVANTSVDLQFTGGLLVWTGDTSGNWDINSTQNWDLGGNADVYLDGDDVIFDDTATTATVTLAGSVSPASVEFDNSVLNYQISGGTLAGGGGLIKAGTGTAVITSDTTYTGTTLVDEGTLAFGDGGTLGQIGAGTVDILAGATLRLNRSDFLDYKTVARMRTVTGAGEIVLTGGGTLFNYPGGGTAFASAGTWNQFSGNLVVVGGSEFQTIRNGATAMGTGSIVLGDGTSSGKLSQIEGNWTWTNNIVLTGSDNRIINRSAGIDRTLKLQGVISGSGGLTFEDATAAMNNLQRGFILTGENTLDGTLTIPAGVPVRVGGVPGQADATQLGGGAAGTLGSATVVNEGILTFSRTDAHTVANAISGAGNVFVGLTTGTENQVLTLSGSLSHTGTTTVRNGRLILASALPSSAVTVEAAGTLGGSGPLGQNAAISGRVAPGAAVGTLTSSADLAFATGSSVAWEIGDWTGTAGSGYDTISAATLNINATQATPLTVVITPSSLVNFSETTTSFTLATTSGGITGFTGDNVVVDASAFSGTGTWSVAVVGNDLKLNYTAGVPGVTYAGWIDGFYPGETNPALVGFNADPDGDGIDNGLEQFFGTAPNSSSLGLVPLSSTSSSVTASHSQTNDPATDVTVAYQWSSDLATWQASGATDGNGVTATIASTTTLDQASPLNDTVQVTATVTGGSSQRIFLRVSATQNP
ncbi:MAG: autotransporter adhesin family protein [Akkermansiaceae bacterium]|nr:autotransporter adhesin family protein [Akkermansiaceae bacterium]